MKNSFSHQDIIPTMSSIAFSPNPKELTTICANVPTTWLYLRTATLLWNRILFIEWFLKTFIDFYVTFNVILLNAFTQRHLLYSTSASIHLYHVRLSYVIKGFTYLLENDLLAKILEWHSKIFIVRLNVAFADCVTWHFRKSFSRETCLSTDSSKWQSVQDSVIVEVPGIRHRSTRVQFESANEHHRLHLEDDCWSMLSSSAESFDCRSVSPNTNRRLGLIKI